MTTSDTSSADPPAADQFRTNVDEFAGIVRGVLKGTIGDAPDGTLAYLGGESAIIEFEPFPLAVGGETLFHLDLSYGCRPDSSGDYIAVTKSKFSLRPERLRAEPLLRVDYQDDMRTVPSCHWQVYAERGDVVWALAKGSTRRATLGSLHIPVGGARFRPCLEDFLQFVIEELGVDAQPTYRDALAKGRRRYRTIQLKTTVRDAPEDAASALRKLGYTVEPPHDGPGPKRDATFAKW